MTGRGLMLCEQAKDLKCLAYLNSEQVASHQPFREVLGQEVSGDCPNKNLFFIKSNTQENSQQLVHIADCIHTFCIIW